MKKIILILTVLTAFSGLVSTAEEIPTFDKEGFLASAETKIRLELAMVDCVAMALKNNSEILVKEISPLIEDQNVRIQKATFEPILYFDYMMENNVEQSPVGLISSNPSKTRTNTFDFGYDQKWVTGTELGVDLYNTRTGSNSPIQNINPDFDSKFEVTVKQPLMKGFGITVNKADFLIAKNNKLKSVQEFTQDVIRVLTDVKKAYYEFQYSEEQYKVARKSRERVLNLYYINKERYAKGLASNVDLLESEAEVARLEEAVLAAQKVVEKSGDNLKLITNLIDDVEYWNADMVLLEDLTYERTTPGLKESIITAFDHRPDYEAARIDLKNKDISVIYYRNNVLPTVDIISSFALNGLAKNYGKDLAHIGGGKYPDWAVGVNVRLPLFSDKERGEYEKSKLDKKRALIAFKRLEQRIILDVRNAVRDVDISFKVLEASAVAREAEEKNYEAQETRFRAGLVSTLDMLIYEERLAKTELSYVRSVIDYKITLIELARAEGVTLIEDHITIE